jgi:hypothetical protein
MPGTRHANDRKQGEENMQIKLLASVAAIALVAGLASASAAEKFATLDGISADVMSIAEMDAAKGQASMRVVTTDGPGVGTGSVDGSHDVINTYKTRNNNVDGTSSSGNNDGLQRAEGRQPKMDCIC